ncbi:MAG: hypothetical protein QOI78_9310 [Actinomycetota bacterium]|nr:hypothetical protein [Actinomycetota bacterium]
MAGSPDSKATFASTGVRREGNRWFFSGDLALRDVAKGVETELEFLGADPTGVQREPRGGLFRHHHHTQRFGVDFGLVDGAKVVVGDQLEVAAFLTT